LFAAAWLALHDSHTLELMALEDFLLCRQLQDVVLVWVTDSQSAMWSVNKGRCHEARALVVLSNILRMCDDAHVQIIALWVPREQNKLADYLSHFAYMSDSDECSGWLADLGLPARC
jgi:hypothetical protein